MTNSTVPMTNYSYCDIFINSHRIIMGISYIWDWRAVVFRGIRIDQLPHA